MQLNVKMKVSALDCTRFILFWCQECHVKGFHFILFHCKLSLTLNNNKVSFQMFSFVETDL